MGCMHSNGSAVEDNRENPKDGGLSSSRRLPKLENLRLDSSRGEIGYGAKVMLFDQKANGSARLRGHQVQKSRDDRNRGKKQRREKADQKGAVVGYESISRVPIESRRRGAGGCRVAVVAVICCR